MVVVVVPVSTPAVTKQLIQFSVDLTIEMVVFTYIFIFHRTRISFPKLISKGFFSLFLNRG